MYGSVSTVDGMRGENLYMNECEANCEREIVGNARAGLVSWCTAHTV